MGNVASSVQRLDHLLVLDWLDRDCSVEIEMRVMIRRFGSFFSIHEKAWCFENVLESKFHPLTGVRSDPSMDDHAAIVLSLFTG